MPDTFDYFVVFAEMRTGSNFLEANINAIDGLACHGEAFNPHFIGYPNRDSILDVDLAEREADPQALLDAIKADPAALGGFRFFHDHDPRILESCLQDPRCAKIILTRNPMDSYVSWKIAQATGQWKLTDVRKRKDSQVVFDGEEFTAHVAKLQAFQVFLMNSLQRAGQTAFYVAYEDLQDVDVMNGLAKYLGVSGRIDALDSKLKRQNPSHISDKVANFEAIPAAISDLDQFNLSRTPNFEPRRGAAVPSYVAAPDTGLMFLPIAGGPEQDIAMWLAELDGTTLDGLVTKMNQKQLRHWKRGHQPHRAFCVLRHPVARAYHAFCTKILSTGAGSYNKIRRTLRNRYGLPIPETLPDVLYDTNAHRVAFAEYLRFVRANLVGQTAIRQDAFWASQASIVTGFSAFALPDVILREAESEAGLAALAQQVGCADAPRFAAGSDRYPFALDDIYDDAIEALTREAYQRDYVTFGFENWR
ncbi:MAG: nodulation protein NodH [Cognatishimia sp.]